MKRITVKIVLAWIIWQMFGEDIRFYWRMKTLPPSPFRGWEWQRPT